MAFALGAEGARRRLPARSATRRSARPTARRSSARGQGDPGRLWVVVEGSRRGRGRRGRAWETPHGNLAASLLLVGHGELQACRDARLRRRAGASEALAAVVPNGRIGISVDGVDDASAEAVETLRAEMAERRAGSTAPSSPASCSKRAQLDGGRYARGDRHRRQCRRASRRPALSGDLACRTAAPRLTPRRCSWRWPMPGRPGRA